MKSLIVTIIVAILAMSLTGCVVVEEHRHRHARHTVVVTSPRHLPIGPGHPHHPDARRHMPERPHPRFKHRPY